MPPISSNPASNLADEVRRLGKDCNIDLAPIASAIKEAEAKRKTEAVEALRGVMTLEKRKAPRGRRFRLGIVVGNDYDVLHGTDYAFGKYVKESEETDAQRIFLDEPGHGIDYEWYTMHHLEKSLKNSNIPYILEYAD